MHPVVILVLLVTTHVLNWIFLNRPFMDEQFHFKQLDTWHRLGLPTYDPMITTPPGLYLIPLLLFGGVWHIQVSLWMARLVNLFYILAFIHVLKGLDNYGVILNPLVVFYQSLYYTDIGALAFTLLYWKHSSMMAFFYGIMALMFRQTSIVWILFSDLYKFVKSGEIRRSGLYLLLVFVIFAYANNGIALGDRKHHTVIIHLPQLLYCMTVCVFLNWPSMNVRVLFKRYWRPYWSFTAIPIVLAVHYCTFMHPYLYTDDRHLVNLFWGWFMARYEFRMAYAVFVYTPCLFLVYTSVARRQGHLVSFLFLIFSALAVVPSPLVEPRYYMIPSIMHSILITPRRGKGKRVRQVMWDALTSIVLYALLYTRGLIL